MDIKNAVKKNLAETKEKKENLLIEQSLVRSRLLIIFENEDNIKNFKYLPKNKKLKYTAQFISELKSLSDEGLINEQFAETLKSIFGSSVFGGLAQTIFEPMVNTLLARIGFPEGFFRDAVVSFITSKPSEIIGAFNDCRILTKLIVESMVEATIMTLQKKGGLSGYPLTMLRNTLGSAMKDIDFVKKIEGSISNNICGLMDKFTNNAKKVADKLNTTKPQMSQDNVKKQDSESGIMSTLKSYGM